MILIKETLGDEWLQPELFRFGASGLLNDIEAVIYSWLFARKRRSSGSEWATTFQSI